MKGEYKNTAGDPSHCDPQVQKSALDPDDRIPVRDFGLKGKFQLLGPKQTGESMGA